ncbi:uncharacterized protein VSU04_017323 isoform 1-T1 [Chlamydotis macqueenii]
MFPSGQKEEDATHDGLPSPGPSARLSADAAPAGVSRRKPRSPSSSSSPSPRHHGDAGEDGVPHRRRRGHPVRGAGLGPEDRWLPVFGDERVGGGGADGAADGHVPLQRHGPAGRRGARLHLRRGRPVPAARALAGERLRQPQRARPPSRAHAGADAPERGHGGRAAAGAAVLGAGGRAERRFRFYGEREELGAAQAAERLRVAAVSRRHAGNVSCGYEEETEGRWIPSHRSRALRVLVKEAAAAPRLAVDPPGGVVSEAYPLRLTCAAARADFALRFRFYRDGAELRAGQGGSRSRTEGASALLLFPRAPRGFGGEFSCGTEEDVGGTWVPAPRSPGVEVTVKDLPPPPALLSDPPSGEVPEGSPLLLTCAAAAGPRAPRRFVFYRDGAEQFAETGAGDRALFSVPAANGSRAGGRFTCRYEEKVGDSWIPSPVSRALTVVTQARPRLVPLAAGCAAGGGAALLLGLLLAACLFRRRRGGVHWKGLHDKDDAGAYAMASVSGSDEG